MEIKDWLMMVKLIFPQPHNHISSAKDEIYILNFPMCNKHTLYLWSSMTRWVLECIFQIESLTCNQVFQTRKYLLIISFFFRFVFLSLLVPIPVSPPVGDHLWVCPPNPANTLPPTVMGSWHTHWLLLYLSSARPRLHQQAPAHVELHFHPLLPP